MGYSKQNRRIPISFRGAILSVAWSPTRRRFINPAVSFLRMLGDYFSNIFVIIETQDYNAFRCRQALARLSPDDLGRLMILPVFQFGTGMPYRGLC